MDLRLIHCFVEVAKTGSFTKAGERLFLSQSALSKAIQELETEWNTRLFDRSTRRIRLTDAGELFLRQAQNVLVAVDELSAIVGDLTNLHKGFVRMGLPPVIGSSFYPDIIATFQQKYPGIHIEFTENGSKKIESLILEGLLDIGMVVLPVDTNQFKMMPLVDRNLHLVVHPQHRYAQVDRVKLKELQDENFLLFDRGFAIFHSVYDACVQSGFEPHIEMESSQWDFLTECVAAGIGITFLPETICTRLESGRQAIIREVIPPIPWRLGLIWSQKHVLNHAELAWIDFVQDWFRSNER